MAKKVRRVKKKRKETRQKSSTQNVSDVAAPTSETATGKQLSSSEQFRLEYAYVVKDLRRVLILAALMFALLITLNLVLQ
jgi:hypothetical protein